MLPAPPLAWPVVLYAFGVLIGLGRIDAPWVARVGLALLWPLGPLAFLITTTTLLLASLIAFPVLGAVAIALALAFAAFGQTADRAPAASPPLEARFIGNMALSITDGSLTLFSDFPYQSGYSIYMEYNASEIRSSTPQAVSLITHRHGDHWEPARFNRTDWRVIAPEDALTAVAPERIIRALPVRPAPSTLTVGPIAVEALPTPHAGIGHYSYLVTWHGRRLYFTGDTESVDRLLAVNGLDVAFVSPWLYDRAQRDGRRIDARRIVIYHHTSDEVVTTCRDTCVVPRQGQSLTF